MMKHTLLLLFFAARLVGQHVTDYVQYPFAPVLINPSFCGAEGAMTVGMLHHDQWTKMEGAPEGNSIFLHTPLRNKSFNAGLLIEQERFGVFQHSRYSGLYAYRVRLGRGKLALGLSAGYETYLNNWNMIVTTTGIDPRFSQGATRVISPHFAGGASYSIEGFSASLAFPQLYGNNGPYAMYVVGAEYRKNISQDISLRPVLLYRSVPAGPDNLAMTLCTSYRDVLTLGLSGSTSRTYSALLNFRCNSQMQLGYSYSRLLTNLDTYNGATHELSLQYTFRYKVKSISSR